MIKEAILGRPGTIFMLVFYGTLSLVNGWNAGFTAQGTSHGIISAVAAVGCLSYALCQAFRLGRAVGLER